jgi:hypothetical protein
MKGSVGERVKGEVGGDNKKAKVRLDTASRWNKILN